MPNRAELIQALVELEPSVLEDVVNSAYRQRSLNPPSEPASEASPEQFAQWLARRHLSTDAALDRVVYLPSGAPRNEIRLLEVNRLTNDSEAQAIEPLDFTPEDSPYRVFVADISSDTWERIKQSPKALLPPKWRLKDNKIFTRD